MNGGEALADTANPGKGTFQFDEQVLELMGLTDQLGEGGEGRLAALIEPAFGGDDLTLKGGRDAFDPAMIGRRPIEHDLGLGDR